MVVFLFDVTTELGIPTFRAGTYDLGLGTTGAQCGYGCHFDPFVAMERAILEAVQSRACYLAGARDDMFRRGFLFMRQNDQGPDVRFLQSLPEEPAVRERFPVSFGTIESEWDAVLKRLERHGFYDVLVKPLAKEPVGTTRCTRCAWWCPTWKATATRCGHREGGPLSTSSDSLPETVLVYAGPSVSEREVFERVPNAVVRPPVRQSDLLSDLHAVNPTHVLLIDGEFQQSFSVWLKEVMYAIVHPGVRGVYGASSMGAIRAAELHGLGMVGFGKVFAAYRDGVTFDDAEVAVAYQRDREGRYRSTVPMVNLRFSKVTPEQWDAAQAIHWSERWPHRLAQAVPGLPEIVDQKHEDALELLETFRSLKPSTDTRPSPQHLNGFFLSQYDRDRRIPLGNGKCVCSGWTPLWRSKAPTGTKRSGTPPTEPWRWPVRGGVGRGPQPGGKPGRRGAFLPTPQPRRRRRAGTLDLGQRPQRRAIPRPHAGERPGVGNCNGR
jgi:hypothetical protein